MIQLANAPCSWGILEPLGPRPPGTQATSARRGEAGRAREFTQTEPPPLRPSRFLDEVAESGYVGTELGDWGFLPTDAAQLHDELAARGLAMAGAFVPVALADPAAHEAGGYTAVRLARLMREAFERTGEPTRLPPVIVLSDDNCAVAERCAKAGRIAPGDGLTEAQWTVFAQGADGIAAAVRNATGLRTVFHPHCGGYVETAAEIETLLAHTDPALVGLCVDTGHLTYAGADVLRTIATHVRRVWHVHFKDCSSKVAAEARAKHWDYLTALGHGLFCELGRGSVPFARVLDALHAYHGWIVVEQDVLPGMGTPHECARRNRDFLRGLGL